MPSFSKSTDPIRKTALDPFDCFDIAFEVEWRTNYVEES